MLPADTLKHITWITLNIQVFYRFLMVSDLKLFQQTSATALQIRLSLVLFVNVRIFHTFHNGITQIIISYHFTIELQFYNLCHHQSATGHQ